MSAGKLKKMLDEIADDIHVTGKGGVQGRAAMSTRRSRGASTKGMFGSSGSVIGGQVQDFSGAGITDFSGAGITDFSGAGKCYDCLGGYVLVPKKMAGGIVMEPLSAGSVVVGGSKRQTSGLQGGRGSGLQGGSETVGGKKTPKALGPWMLHLASVRKANPGMSLKDAMKKASASYKK